MIAENEKSLRKIGEFQALQKDGEYHFDPDFIGYILKRREEIRAQQDRLLEVGRACFLDDRNCIYDELVVPVDFSLSLDTEDIEGEFITADEALIFGKEKHYDANLEDHDYILRMDCSSPIKVSIYSKMNQAESLYKSMLFKPGRGPSPIYLPQGQYRIRVQASDRQNLTIFGLSLFKDRSYFDYLPYVL